MMIVLIYFIRGKYTSCSLIFFLQISNNYLGCILQVLRQLTRNQIFWHVNFERLISIFIGGTFKFSGSILIYSIICRHGMTSTDYSNRIRMPAQDGDQCLILRFINTNVLTLDLMISQK